MILYNALGLATSVSVGTSDGTLWPGESSAPASNMVKVSAEAYNADGLLEMSVAENLNPQGLSTPVDSGTVTVDSSTTGSGYLMYGAERAKPLRGFRQQRLLYRRGLCKRPVGVR